MRLGVKPGFRGQPRGQQQPPKAAAMLGYIREKFGVAGNI